MGKLTDRQRKQIVAEYVAGDGSLTQRELAKRYQVSQKTISKILGDEESTQKVSNKKKENELSMLAFLDDRARKAQGLIDKILETLPADFEKANMRDKAGLLKILSEVFSGGGKAEEQAKREEYGADSLHKALCKRKIKGLDDDGI